LADWYDPGDVPSLVRKDQRTRLPGRAACVTGGDLEACRVALTAAGGIPLPTTSDVRGSFYQHALAIGGPDALVRLRAVPGSAIGPRLEAASGLPIDTVIARWHASVVGEPTTAALIGAGTVARAVLWSLIFFALFAWRYRWHHA
jgi:hypothetical protein